MTAPARPRFGTALETFAARTALTDDGCLLWIGPLDAYGYGNFWTVTPTGRRKVKAHRWSWEYANGPISAGLVIDHFRCGNTACVHPDHLRPAGRRENVLRSDTSVPALHLAKTHCDHGHPFDERNTYVRKDNGGRQCRRCAADRVAARKARKRALACV